MDRAVAEGRIEAAFELGAQAARRVGRSKGQPLRLRPDHRVLVVHLDDQDRVRYPVFDVTKRYGFARRKAGVILGRSAGLTRA